MEQRCAQPPCWELCCVPWQQVLMTDSGQGSWPQCQTRKEHDTNNVDQWDLQASRASANTPQLEGAAGSPLHAQGLAVSQGSQKGTRGCPGFCPAQPQAAASPSSGKATAQQTGKIQSPLVPLHHPRRQGHGQTEGKSQGDPQWEHGPTPAPFPLSNTNAFLLCLKVQLPWCSPTLPHSTRNGNCDLPSVLIQAKVITQGCPEASHEQRHHCHPQLSL